MRLTFPGLRWLAYGALLAVTIPLGYLFDSRACAETFRAQLIEGTPTSELDYPYVARLNYEGDLLCTGTLITTKHILTAAHCFFGEDGQRVVGNTDILARLNGQEVSSSRITIHPSYKARESACVDGETDAAIVELSESIFGVQPVPLLTSPVPLGASVLLVGYGTEGSGSLGEGNTIPAVGLVNYGPTVVEGFGDYPGQIDLNSLYYYWRFDEGESNTASGDSGGPAFYDVGGERFISGITCGGDGRAEYGSYSWNTRADKIANWVTSVTGQAPSGSKPLPESSLIVSGASLEFYAERSDYLEVSGAVFVGNSFNPRSKKVTISISDYSKQFRLDRRGQSVGRGKSYLNLRGTLKRGKFKDSMVRFTLFIEHASLFTLLPDLGFNGGDEAADGDQVVLPLSVAINGMELKAEPVLEFSLDSEQWELVQ